MEDEGFDLHRHPGMDADEGVAANFYTATTKNDLVPTPIRVRSQGHGFELG